MSGNLRETGISAIGEVPWSTHLCQFYHSRDDLLDVLVPYFKAGLTDNEFCMWITSSPLTPQDALQAMAAAMPDFDRYLAMGQIEVLPHTSWYTRDGYFDLNRTLNGWVDKLRSALANGYQGLRVTGNTAWLEKEDWRSFAEYEAAINGAIANQSMISLCTYCLDSCNAVELIDVAHNHEFALIRQEGKWELLENSSYKATREALTRSEDRYRGIVDNAHESIWITEARVRRQNEVLETINRVLREGLICETEEDLGRICLTFAEELTQSKFGFIGKINPEGLLDDIAISDPGWAACRVENQTGHGKLPVSFKLHGLYARTVLKGKLFFTNDPASEPDSIGVPSGHPPLTAFLGVPLSSGCKMIGMVGLANRPGGYREQDREAMEAVAPAIAEAIVHKMAQETVRQSEEKLKRLNEDLGRHVAQLEAANKELEAFSYSVSHDLRAPLRSLEGFSQALLEDYGDRLDEQGRDFLGRIQQSSVLMAQLIDDMLKLSRVTRAEMKWEEVDLGRIAHHIIAERRKMDPKRIVEFTVTPGLIAQGDARLIHVLVENLLDNAWKFTGRATLAKIEMGEEEHDGKKTYFVRDNGAGFDMTYAGKLFLPLQRLHRTSEYPGTGIGLATVQRIVNRHGGRVWAEGQVGQGATFYFTLGR